MNVAPNRGRVPGLVATGLGVGRIPAAPGTFASLAALLLAAALNSLGGPILVLAAFLGAVWAGVWAIRRLPDRGARDAPEIVIDEVAGQFLAVLPICVWLSRADTGSLDPWSGWVASFLLFRFFDILKPWPVGRFDRGHGAWAIMADDLAAGALAGAATLLAGWTMHGVLG